jgi:hypothetical protein
MRNILQYLSMVLITAHFVGCATPVVHNTPSGRPEITVSGKVGKRASAEITNLMVNRGYNVKVSSDTLIVFEKPIESTMAAVLLGSRYDSTPAARITYNIIETEATTRVIASFAAVTNPGSAFERITPMNNIQDTDTYQMRLNEIKAKLEGRQ